MPVTSRLDPAEIESEFEFNSLLRSMRARGEEITRENYIRNNWHPVPDPWTAEDEAELPPFLWDTARFPQLAD